MARRRASQAQQSAKPNAPTGGTGSGTLDSAWGTGGSEGSVASSGSRFSTSTGERLRSIMDPGVSVTAEQPQGTPLASAMGSTEMPAQREQL